MATIALELRFTCCPCACRGIPAIFCIPGGNRGRRRLRFVSFLYHSSLPRSLDLTLQAFPPPAKRRAAAHICPQPAFTGVLPEPPVFTIYQEEPTCQCGVYAAQAARPPALEERSVLPTQAQVNLDEDQQALFVRPVGKEEAIANTASAKYDKAMFHCTGIIPGARVVVATTGLIWEQKGQMHSPLRGHMESLDVLISEEAQQDMDLKSAFVPAVPRQPFFRIPPSEPRRSSRQPEGARRRQLSRGWLAVWSGLGGPSSCWGHWRSLLGGLGRLQYWPLGR